MQPGKPLVFVINGALVHGDMFDYEDDSDDIDSDIDGDPTSVFEPPHRG